MAVFEAGVAGAVVVVVAKVDEFRVGGEWLAAAGAELAGEPLGEELAAELLVGVAVAAGGG